MQPTRLDAKKSMHEKILVTENELVGCSRYEFVKHPSLSPIIIESSLLPYEETSIQYISNVPKTKLSTIWSPKLIGSDVVRQTTIHKTNST